MEILTDATIVSLLIFCALFLYCFLTKNYTYWSSRNVPSPRPLFLFGNIKDRMFMKVSFHEFVKNYYFKMRGNPYAGFYEGRRPTLMVLDPELLKCILVRDFDHFMDRAFAKFRASPYTYKMLILLTGGEWKRVRAAITPTFSSGKMKSMFNLVVECGNQLSNYISKKINENDGVSTGDIEIKDTLGKFTLDVIANCAFGVQTDSLENPKQPFVEKISIFNTIPLAERFTLITCLILQIPEFITSKLPLSFFNRETISFLSGIVKEAKKLRSEHNFRRNDFLQLLLDAQEKVFISEGDDPDSKGYIIDEDTAVAQAILFFIAGFETSSSVLTMACYELAKNVEIQDRLRTEIKSCLEKYDGELNYESLNEMTYLDMVIAEALRMYPPVARLDRICVKEYLLGNKLKVEPGIHIGVPVIGLHYDPDYFPNPDTFDPERFTPEAKASRHPYAYLPFGAGPRNCIGLRFAQMTTKVCMVYLMKDFSVGLSENTQIPFVYHKASMLLKPKDGVILNVQKL